MKDTQKPKVQRRADLPSAFGAEIRLLRHLIAGPDRKLSHIGNSSLNGPDDHGP
jgi:hypothetical protein